MHLGHLLVAQAACEEFGLDRLCFIPAAQSPFKPGSEPASAKARLQMLRLALAGQARLVSVPLRHSICAGPDNIEVLRRLAEARR